MNFQEKLLAQHIAVLGKTGSGKTCTAKLLVEQVVESGARVCVLDPIKSDWWGLTSSSNGKHAGLPFHILGGPRGHVPLHAQAGAAIGEIVADGRLPLSILDMSEFEMGGLQQFFVQFAPTLLRKMRGVLYLVVEEAHEFAPKERGGFGAENMAIHFAKKLAVAGRSRGIRLIVATQRTQSLHNAILGSCDTLIAHRMTAPADQEPIVKWLKANLPPEKAKEVAASLQSLKTGEAWICSGELGLFDRRQFPRIATYDNTATPTTEGRAIEVETAAVDREKLRSIIGTAVDEAKANDPRELKAEVLKLRSEIARMKAHPLIEVKPPVEVPVITDSQMADLKVFEANFESSVLAAGRLLDEFKQTFARLTAPKPFAMAPMLVPRNYPRDATAVPAAESLNSELPGTQRKILDAVCMLQVRGIEANRDSVARWLDIHPNGGRYGSDLAALRATGLLDGFGLTQGGARIAQTMPTGIEGAKVPLDGTQRTIIDVLLAAGGHRFTRETLAAKLGIHPNGGRYGSDLARLRTMGLIPERGDIYLTAEAFR